MIARSVDGWVYPNPEGSGTGQPRFGAIGRATFQPGRRWSAHVKPVAGTDGCRAAMLKLSNLNA